MESMEAVSPFLVYHAILNAEAQLVFGVRPPDAHFHHGRRRHHREADVKWWKFGSN
jgi:hypothetical protein